MSHDHAHHVGGDRRRLAIAFAITASVLVVQAVGGVLTGSLALLADAGHMASDAIALAVALVASIVAARPATSRHTFGFQRVEVLAALVNGLLLAGVAVSVGSEGIRRLLEPGDGEVLAAPMLLVAGAGLLANVIALLVLRGGDRGSLNLRGAYLEVLGDLLGSIAAIAAGLVILTTGFMPADAIASLVIAGLILPRAMLLLRDVVRVLTESAPHDTDVEQIREHLEGADGVVAVHDVHVWAITSGNPVFTAHVVVEPGIFERGEASELLDRLGGCLRGHFDVEHSTFQLEPAGHAEREEHAHR
ncbi:cation diffusion facilitator family transporter [Homoserinibacter sp. YIM 151385]|uniref:cation diffusion facilitator family transporter n=1 Tax=Homoserinibacter sp. YIM 151385 TaxID=2985506 RepID=UPI0022F10D10|nr:cation diffusion facilitator family transporter [Homoserinibacter sp. YIM 151385]WBU38181.1 cation diffusion facilitator family transporter [Homoserinibacter sp. YIM 151385]